MTQISQKAAVINEVKSILGSSFNESLPAKDQLTKEQFVTLKNNIVFNIINGSVAFGKETEDEKEISTYVSGMISNHFRKSKELNGGESYEPQASAKGSRDPQVVELNKLLKTYAEGSAEYIQIFEAISARKSTLASAKAATTKTRQKTKELASIDFDMLPENLRGLASSLVSGN